MTKAIHADRVMIVATLLLVAMGLLMVYSTSNIIALNKYGDSYFFVKRQVTFSALGLAALFLAMRVPYTFYRRLAYPLLIIALIGLCLIFIEGIGRKVGGARRWIDLGFMTFQPSEAAKLSVIVFLAYSLAAKEERIKEFYAGFLPNVVIPGVIIAMILMEPDLGTALALSTVVIILNFTAGVRLSYLTGLCALGAVFLYFLVSNVEYMMRRILIFIDPWKDPSGSGFQMVQSFLAFGSGGIYGVGLGAGKQKLFFLPEAHTDFILSVIGEELGLIGVGGVIVLYILFLFAGTKIALRAKDLYGTYLALGLTFMVVLQAALNMAVVLGVLPPKGLPLPFISYGGSSLLINMVSAGILLNIYIKSNEV
ncbi:MAG: putative lipid II flippase FtsW [Thermodesulfobacteriota bacterium]